MIMILTSVIMVGWVDVPDSDQGDFRRRCAVVISSLVMHSVLEFELVVRWSTLMNSQCHWIEFSVPFYKSTTHSQLLPNRLNHFMDHIHMWHKYNPWGDDRCVSYHFQVTRSKVKVTRTGHSNFRPCRLHSLLHMLVCICGCDGGILVDHQSTISSSYRKVPILWLCNVNTMMVDTFLFAGTIWTWD